MNEVETMRAQLVSACEELSPDDFETLQRHGRFYDALVRYQTALSLQRATCEHRFSSHVFKCVKCGVYAEDCK